MTDEGVPRFDPDVDYTAWVAYPYAQIRVEIGLERGDVRWFLVQLEYNVGHEPYGDDDWRQVAGFDHHPQADWGHDVTAERLHLDIYHDGRKRDVKRGFPDVPLDDAPGYCERFLHEHADHYLDQFERWHDATATEQYNR